MAEYRRGIDGSTKHKLWHFNEQCREYPTRGFVIADYQPFHEDVCQECLSLTRGKHPSPQQDVPEVGSEGSLQSRLERVGRLVRDKRRHQTRGRLPESDS